MPVVIVIAAIAILAAVVYVATGRGGELSAENADYAPLDLGPVSATDVALLRPPTALWGYSVEVTDDALDRIAEAIRERDVRIVALEQLVTDLGREPSAQPLSSPAYPSARHRRAESLTSPAGFGAAGGEPGARDVGARDGGARDGGARDTDASDGDASGGEWQRERGISGGGAPPEQSHD